MPRFFTTCFGHASPSLITALVLTIGITHADLSRKFRIPGGVDWDIDTSTSTSAVFRDQALTVCGTGLSRRCTCLFPWIFPIGLFGILTKVEVVVHTNATIIAFHGGYLRKQLPCSSLCRLITQQHACFGQHIQIRRVVLSGSPLAILESLHVKNSAILTGRRLDLGTVLYPVISLQ